jgi:hypothetical protein
MNDRLHPVHSCRFSLSTLKHAPPGAWRLYRAYSFFTWLLLVFKLILVNASTLQLQQAAALVTQTHAKLPNSLERLSSNPSHQAAADDPTPPSVVVVNEEDWSSVVLVAGDEEDKGGFRSLSLSLSLSLSGKRGCSSSTSMRSRSRSRFRNSRSPAGRRSG